MPSTETTPRFRRLSIVGASHFASSSGVFSEKDHEEHRDPEKECFMCRQANVYIKPIGMQQERQVARRYPPPLTRAQMEELSLKKHLTKREARKLLQCYFPEIKNVKYFQLHKYHSCCYDPKHLNLCKNHITSLQHDREAHPNRFPHRHVRDEEHYRAYERGDGEQNRVSFVRIKIEPTKGIPTRFLGPTALPESLADMLIKQVNRFENKKKPPSFGLESENTPQMYNVRRVSQPYDNGTGRLSEYLENLSSDDEDNDDSDNDDDEKNGNPSNATSSIRGFNGKVMDRSRMKYERKIQVTQEKQKLSAVHSNDDLVVEDVDELNQLFADRRKPPVEVDVSAKPLKKKKRKRRTKKRTQTHPTPKLNHWEILALDQSKKEVCGCRHHVRRLEADQIVYDWCRCKDHRHRDLTERRKSIPPPPPPPPPPPSIPPSPPKEPKKITPPPKTPKIEKRTVSVDATEPMTNELALAYDPSTVEYDVISEALYYRTSSGRLVKPEITNAFTYNSTSPSTTFNHHRSLPKKSEVLYTVTKAPFQSSASGSRQHGTTSRTSSNIGSISNRQTLIDVTEVSSTKNGTDEPVPSFDLPIASPTKTGDMYPINDDDEEESEDEGPQFIPPRYTPERSETTPVRSPTLPTSMQKSSKPTYTNQKPTPNFERESSVLASRRWFDQPLGDQNLLPVHDGRYGLIAGTSTDGYQMFEQLPDNDYVEPYRREHKSNCTIS